ncbi:cytochrome c biogenesis protein CcsA [Candidatus Berkiella aquae]|nr:cytochrome c biogenesis protein CcsA [Candidatus Berkiella aquae]MCS5712436.1 cytochrome c biogenesis protein CcsA [Candidatus Berkiella aquae]
MNLENIGILTFLLYISIALAQGFHLFGRLTFPRWQYRVGSFLALSGHGWLLYRYIEMPEGQNLYWLCMLSFTLWLMNIITLIASFRAQVANLSSLTFPLSAISLALVMHFAGSDIMDTKAHPGVLAHIFISMFAISLLLLASLQAIFMGLQNHLLKHHKPSAILHILPPLQAMETLLFYIIWCGVLFFSGSLLSGFFYQGPLLTSHLLPKIILALCAWVLLVSLLLGRYRFGWRGPTAIRWTLSGTTFALLSYFGTKALLF